MSAKTGMVPFEEDNLRAYTLLLRIEVVVRELLRRSLETDFGVHWQKRLPGQLLTKIRESQREENRPQFNFIRLGPLYYLTLGELLPLLQQKAGSSVAERLGGDRFVKQLENLLTPRNAICHSRPVSSVGLKVIEALYAQMEAALRDELAELMLSTDTGLRPDEAAKVIVPLLEQDLRDLPSLPASLAIPEVYDEAILQYWWADDLLAGFNRSKVESAVVLMREYNALPRGVGSAWNRERLCQHHKLNEQIQDAITELRKTIS